MFISNVFMQRKNAVFERLRFGDLLMSSIPLLLFPPRLQCQTSPLPGQIKGAGIRIL